MILNKVKLPAALLSGVIIGAVAFTAVSANAHFGGGLTDEERAEKQVEIQERKAEVLDEKVDEGVITQEQREQIDAWLEERLAEKLESSKDRLSKEEWQALSDEERQELKEERKAEIEERKAEAADFFESIGVDKDELFDGVRKGFGKRGQHR